MRSGSHEPRLAWVIRKLRPGDPEARTSVDSLPHLVAAVGSARTVVSSPPTRLPRTEPSKMEQAIEALLITQRQLADSQVQMMQILANAPAQAGLD